MADLGAIGIKHTSESVRLVPLSTASPTNTARTLTNPVMRVIFDVADAQIPKYFRAWVQSHNRISFGRQAVYLKDFKEIRGTIKNSAGTGISRRYMLVNAYGQCVGTGISAGDGTFKCLTDNQIGYVYAIALPDDVEARNAVVKWKITPVAAV